MVNTLSMEGNLLILHVSSVTDCHNRVREDV